MLTVHLRKRREGHPIMLDKIQEIISKGIQVQKLDKVFKWIRVKRNAILVFSVILLISAGIFSATALATNNESTLKKGMLKAYFTYCDGQNIAVVENKED